MKTTQDPFDFRPTDSRDVGHNRADERARMANSEDRPIRIGSVVRYRPHRRCLQSRQGIVVNMSTDGSSLTIYTTEHARIYIKRFRVSADDTGFVHESLEDTRVELNSDNPFLFG